MTARVVVAAIALVFAMSCFAGTQTRTSAFEYDPASGLLIREVIEPDTSALCLVTTYQYDAYGNKTSTTTRNCNGTATGGLTEAPAPTGDPVFASRTSGTAFAAGSVVIGATTYNWNAGQFATSSTNALNHPETRQFDPRFGSVVSLTGPNLLTTNWTYDSFGRKSSETRADGTITNWFYERCVDLAAGTCPTLGQYRVRVTATGAPTTSTYYDSLAREIRAETQGFDSTLVRKDTQYDSLGRVAQVSRPYYATATPAWTVFTLYDVLGRVTQADEPATSSGQVRTVTAYNSVVTTNPNRWSTTVTVSNAGVGTNMPAGVTQTRTTTKNSQGQVVQVRDTRGSPLDYTYDEFGNLKTTTDALVNVTTLSYDLRGRKTQMVDPDMGTWSYFYDALGQLIRQTDAKSQTATMVYDLLGRMTSRTEPDLISSWTYDSCTKGIGKLCQASANNGYSRTQSYDSLGRPATLSTTIDTAYPITTTYDSSGRADTVTYPTGFAVQNVYNIYGYLWKVQRADVGGSTVFWQANTKSASGQVTSELLGNTLTQTRTLDVLDRLGSIVASGTPGTVHNFGYTYDAIGNVAQRVDSVDGVTENFGYDNLNRLLSASGPGLVTRSFDYNAIGNMIYKSDVGTYAYPASGIGSVRPHAVSSVTGTVNATYTYDANGNLSSGAGRTLTYMSFNLPLTITGTPATYTYTYSPEHERVKLLTQLATGTQTSIYLHPGGKGSLFYEKNIKPDLSLEHKHYVQAGATLVGVYVTKSAYASGDGPQMRYYHRDHLGSIAAISNDVGAIIERLAYEAYGQRRFPNGTADPGGSLFGITTNRGFTAHEHLDELQLIHMNGRVYDPLLGRFMTADLFVQSPNNLQSYNRYSYTLNNPLVYTDPTGYFNLGKALRRLATPVIGVLLIPVSVVTTSINVIRAQAAGAQLILDGHWHDGVAVLSQSNLYFAQRMAQNGMMMSNPGPFVASMQISGIGNVLFGSRATDSFGNTGRPGIYGILSRPGGLINAGGNNAILGLPYDINDVFLGYYGVPTASSIDFAVSHRGERPVGHSLGALDAVNLVSYGLAPRADIYALPGGVAAPYGANVTVGRHDPVNGVPLYFPALLTGDFFGLALSLSVSGYLEQLINPTVNVVYGDTYRHRTGCYGISDEPC